MYSDELESLLSRGKIKVGDKIRVKTEKEEFEGLLMPRPEVGDSSVLVLKLSNGYNIGLRYSSGMTVGRLGSTKSALSFPKSKSKPDLTLPKVTMIATGGTIESRVDYITGGVHPLVKPEELLYEVPELSEIVNLSIINPMSIWSENMIYKEWQLIAKEAEKAFEGGAHGVIVTQGTDTMHYTSAVLSFMLQNPTGPVVLTGAQKSADRGSSDAFMNLICSAHVAAKSDIGEVGICMHATSSDSYCSFIRGAKARKMHTSRRDAFKPINNRPIAKVDVNGKIDYLSDYAKAGTRKKMMVKTGFEPMVALVKFYPGSESGILDYYVSKGYRGIIIEGTGLGNVSTSTKEKKYSWLSHIESAVESGVIVGMTSQCLYGRVNANVYSALRLVSNAGAIYCEDMLPEVAYLKLGFLLGNYGKGEAARLLSKNLVGEISQRTEVDWFM